MTTRTVLKAFAGAAFFTKCVQLLAARLGLTLRLKKLLSGSGAEGQDINQVFFFPEKCLSEIRRKDPDFQEVSTIEGFSNIVQRKDSNIYKILQYLRSANETVDICVFLFTCPEFTHALRDCKLKGVRVRVIIEESNVGCSGCQAGQLRSSGIKVRTRIQPFIMHHKFAIVDSKLLVNGSFNWTSSAVMGNNENVVVTNNRHMVDSFAAEFTRLWKIWDSPSGDANHA